VLGEQRSQRRGTDLLLPVDQDGDRHAGVRTQCTQRRTVRRDAGLVVGRAPTVEPPATLDRFERLAVPLAEVANGLHVVMGVEQDGRGAGGTGAIPDHRGEPAVGGRDGDVGQPGLAELPGDLFGACLQVWSRCRIR